LKKDDTDPSDDLSEGTQEVNEQNAVNDTHEK
jgi:hypothetical protein